MAQLIYAINIISYPVCPHKLDMKNFIAKKKSCAYGTALSTELTD